MPASVAALLAVLAILLGTSFWLDQSQFTPIVAPDSVGYYLCAALPRHLATNVALAGTVLFALHLCVDRLFLRRGRPRPIAPDDLRYLAPLSLIGLNVLALAVLDNRLRDVWAP